MLNNQLLMLQNTFKGELEQIKTTMLFQDQVFKDQFRQLLDVTNQTQLDKYVAMDEIKNLRAEIGKQREEHDSRLWEANSRSVHFRFDALKNLNPVTAAIEGYKSPDKRNGAASGMDTNGMYYKKSGQKSLVPLH